MNHLRPRRGVCGANQAKVLALKPRASGVCPASQVKNFAFLFRLKLGSGEKNMNEDKQPSLRINQGRKAKTL